VNSLVIESEWIVPVESPAIRWGFLVVQEGAIRYVGPSLPACFEELPGIRLAGGAILPGMINSHCHLELSDIDPPIEVPNAGGRPSMVGWLSQIMSRRRALIDLGCDIEQRKRTAIDAGIQAAWETGTRIVIDNITAPWSAHWNQQSSLGLGRMLNREVVRTLVSESQIYTKPCIELVDVTQARRDQTWDFAQQSDASLAADHSACLPPVGLAPHAPYTASTKMVRRAAESVTASTGLLSMHLAESLEEIEYINHRTGPFKDWISPWIDRDHAEHIGDIDEHLEIIAGSHRGLIAHGNYLQESQIETICKHRDKLAVVYCPRTHRHFRHTEHPANRLAAKGIHVFLGTDSKASNPDLSLFEEWKCACKTFPELGPKFWMASCTTDPANFLSLEGLAGTLRVGSQSLLTWIPLGARHLESEEQLWHALVNSDRAMPLEMRIALPEESGN